MFEFWLNFTWGIERKFLCFDLGWSIEVENVTPHETATNNKRYISREGGL
jgi:hypothetical protein